MKHRSVIAFVIVAAALFAAPQLSHDIQSLRSAVGARLRGELLEAFLSLHAEDGASAPAPRPAQTLLASCPKARADAATAGAKKGEQRAASNAQQQPAEAPSAASPRAELAMMTEPEDEPGVWTAQASRARVNVVVDSAAAQDVARAVGEVAMIIPPDSGIDPQALAGLRAASEWRAEATRAAGEEATRRRKAAENLRHLAYISARFDGTRREWQGPSKEELRKLNEALPGSFEFRLDGEGPKAKVLKVIKRGVGAGQASVPAPRAPRLPGQMACLVTAPAAVAQAQPSGE